MTDHALAGRRVLVTGASGFIGSRLCARLQALGCDVSATGRSTTPPADLDTAWLHADLADLDATRAIFAAVQPEIVFHLAGHVAGSRAVELVPETLQAILVGTVNLLVAAHESGCGRLVLAGSMEEPQDESQPTPASPYAAAKWAASGYARLFHRLYGSPTVALRIFMVYGPGQRDERKLVPSTILSLLEGRRPRATSGTRLVDWVFVDDVVDAFVRAALADGVEGRMFDVGTGLAVSVGDVVRRLVTLVDPSLEPIFGALEDRPFETETVADPRPTEDALGWRPSTSLDEGLRLTVDWYAARAARRKGAPGSLAQHSP